LWCWYICAFWQFIEMSCNFIFYRILVNGVGLMNPPILIVPNKLIIILGKSHGHSIIVGKTFASTNVQATSLGKRNIFLVTSAPGCCFYLATIICVTLGFPYQCGKLINWGQDWINCGKATILTISKLVVKSFINGSKFLIYTNNFQPFCFWDIVYSWKK
jgi:hypothetical protein